MNPEDASTPASPTRFYRSKRHALLGGVCSGIATQKGWSVALVRLAALFTLGTGFGILLYLILWVLMPSAEENPTPEPTVLAHDPLTRSKSDRVLGGVCGGLASLLGWDPVLIRVSFVILFISGGLSLIPYVYAWVALPEKGS